MSLLEKDKDQDNAVDRCWIDTASLPIPNHVPTTGLIIIIIIIIIIVFISVKTNRSTNIQ